MSRSRKLPPEPEAPSNVILLRPDVPLTAPKPKARTRRKSLQTKTTSRRNLQAMATDEKGEKSSPTSLLQSTPSSFPQYTTILPKALIGL